MSVWWYRDERSSKSAKSQDLKPTVTSKSLGNRNGARASLWEQWHQPGSEPRVLPLWPLAFKNKQKKCWKMLTPLSHLTPSCFEDSPIEISPIPPLQHRVEHKHLSTLIFRSKAQQLWGASQGPSSAVGHTGTGWNLRHVERFVVTQKISLAVLLYVGDPRENSEKKMVRKFSDCWEPQASDLRVHTSHDIPRVGRPTGVQPRNARAAKPRTIVPIPALKHLLTQSPEKSLYKIFIQLPFCWYSPRQSHFLGRNVVPFQISVSLKNRLPKDGQDW